MIRDEAYNGLSREAVPQVHIAAEASVSAGLFPTCSQYAIEAFEKRGFFVGLALTVWRIIRCNPFCKGGFDPVPEKKNKKNT